MAQSLLQTARCAHTVITLLSIAKSSKDPWTSFWYPKQYSATPSSPPTKRPSTPQSTTLSCWWINSVHPQHPSSTRLYQVVTRGLFFNVYWLWNIFDRHIALTLAGHRPRSLYGTHRASCAADKSPTLDCDSPQPSPQEYASDRHHDYGSLHNTGCIGSFGISHSASRQFPYHTCHTRIVSHHLTHKSATRALVVCLGQVLWLRA